MPDVRGSGGGSPQDVVGGRYTHAHCLVDQVQGVDGTGGVLRFRDRVEAHPIDESVDHRTAAKHATDAGNVSIADEDVPFLIQEVEVLVLLAPFDTNVG